MKETKAGTKGQNTKDKIIKGAMYCLATYGDRGTTFQKIADHCGVSQPLVVHYFRSRENIFPIVFSHMVEQAREKTQKRLQSAKTPKEKLARYLRVSLEIFREEPEIAPIYLMLYYFAGFDERFKTINTEVKDVAVSRISEIIKEGIQQNIFRELDIELTAKTIHNSLVGLLMNATTEKTRFTDNVLTKSLEDTCLRMLAKESL